MGTAWPMVRCPQCGTKFQYDTSAFRPFCSERCRLVDLGHWLSESYSIAGKPDPNTPGGNEGLEEDEDEFQEPEETNDEEDD